MNPTPRFDLPTERPASFDEAGNRVYLHPAEVTGRFRQWRTRLYSALVVFFLVMPWVRIGGHQAILLDIPQRRFAIFGITFWAHDAPMLMLVVASFALTLLFVTAVWGRAWCGWACPQTVFIDMFYRRVETWIEGDHNQRRKLDAAPWSGAKFGKRALKWTAFTGLSLLIAHSFLAYFVGTDRLLEMVTSSPAESPISFMVMLAATGITLFDFGWFREQFCLIACPYGRLQSVLMDTHSIAPLYDEKRGEPRRGHTVTGVAQGDCINCYKCVQVCPTGIDIRRGLQMECIACTACIDVCDEVMVKINKPAGLIRYDSVDGMAGVTPRPKSVAQRIGWRGGLYLVILAVLLTVLAFTVQDRKVLSVSANRAPDSLFTATPDGMIINHFRVHLSNQEFGDHQVKVTVVPDTFAVVMPQNPLPIGAGKTRLIDIFVKFPASALQGGKTKASLEFTTPFDGEPDRKPETQTLKVDLLGPVK